MPISAAAHAGCARGDVDRWVQCPGSPIHRLHSARVRSRQHHRAGKPAPTAFRGGREISRSGLKPLDEVDAVGKAPRSPPTLTIQYDRPFNNACNRHRSETGNGDAWLGSSMSCIS